MSILTDSTPLEEPKNPDTCNVFNIYKTVADNEQTADMRQKYLGGNYGYGHAKKELLELILANYSEQRSKFDYYMTNKTELNAALEHGEEKAKEIADKVLERVKENIGY